MNPLIKAKLRENQEALIELCRAQEVARLEIFGSAVSEKFDPKKSDLDFLVVFERHETPSIVKRYMTLASSLENIFGRKVDLVTARSMKNPYFIKAVNSSKELVYAG